MVPVDSFTEEPMAQPLEVDCDLNPTMLYKLIESKQWDDVISRCEQEPLETGMWIARHRKDGKLRWKILPLHAAICLKAPKEALLKLLNTFPESASSVDDQGMLPIHLALKNDEVDDTFLCTLLNTYPRGIQRKDRKGRAPLEMKGKAIFDCWKLALDMERKKIRAEEKKMYGSKVLSERELLEKEIIKLQDEIQILGKRTSVEAPKSSEEPPKNLELQNIRKEQKLMLDVQSKELATQGELIKKLLAQRDAQEDHLRRMKTLEKARGESTEAQQNEMNIKMEIVIKEQEAAMQVREKKIEERSKFFYQVEAELIVCKEISDRLKHDGSAKDKEIEAQTNLILDMKEDLKGQKIETKKLRDSCEVIKAQVEAYERKVKNLTILNENYRKSLDEMTVVVNDSVLAMRKMDSDPHRGGFVKFSSTKIL